MKRKYFLLSLLLLLVFSLLLFWNRRLGGVATNFDLSDQIVHQKKKLTAQDYDASGLSGVNYSYSKLMRIADSGDSGRQQAWTAAWNAPIDFWGKVLDENGRPIEGATVHYWISNSFDANAERPEGEILSDAQGLFSILGKSGAGLGINVVKAGYYQLRGDNAAESKSGGIYKYWQRGKADVKLPTSDNPAVFVLKKKGELAALIKKNSGSIMLSKDGVPIGVSLKKGQKVDHGADLQVEFWVNSQTEDDAKYDWKCRITVPGGGLIARTEVLDFQAPREGYQLSEEISMLKSSERWTDQIQRQYFLRLSDNTYARVEVGVCAGGEFFFFVKSYLNPQPGDRNLEYDRSKEIRTK